MIDIKVPSPGESISEVELASWLVADGDIVQKDQEIAEIESDKATLTLTAIESGQIKILINEGDIVAVGTTVCRIDTSKATAKTPESKKTPTEAKPLEKESAKNKPPKEAEKGKYEKVKISPVAQKKMKAYNIDVEDVIKGLRRISSNDIDLVSQQNIIPTTTNLVQPVSERKEIRKRMSQLRQAISDRLVAVKNETAMLTTFNEADMSTIMGLRKKYQNTFIEKHGVKLGFMSFFAKAVAQALQHYPTINSMIDGNEVVSYNYVDISIAVQTPKGLMVPVIRNVETIGLADIEKELVTLANKARGAKISLEEMTGGTFTITNGGVFGSMLSTPIINPPQSAILGMHNIMQRPVAIDGKIVIRPMMYLAVSYDHRIVDGKDSVGFLLKIKELIENPQLMLLGGNNTEKMLLEL